MIKRLKKELLEARKNKDEKRKSVLTALVSEAVMVGKNMGNRETTDAEALKIIQKFKKGAVETLGLLDIGSEKYLKFQNEISIYDEFLPTQMTEEELKKETLGYLQVNPDKANIGGVLAHFRQNFDGKYDGKELSKLVNEILRGK